MRRTSPRGRLPPPGRRSRWSSAKPPPLPGPASVVAGLCETIHKCHRRLAVRALQTAHGSVGGCGYGSAHACRRCLDLGRRVPRPERGPRRRGAGLVAAHPGNPPGRGDHQGSPGLAHHSDLPTDLASGGGRRGRDGVGGQYRRHQRCAGTRPARRRRVRHAYGIAGASDAHPCRWPGHDDLLRATRPLQPGVAGPRVATSSQHSARRLALPGANRDQDADAFRPMGQGGTTPIRGARGRPSVRRSTTVEEAYPNVIVPVIWVGCTSQWKKYEPGGGAANV